MQLPARDPEGYLLDLKEWTPELARTLSALEGIQLTEPHWLILNFLREFYLTYEHTPPMRTLVSLLRERFGEAIGNSLTLQQLFPGGPAKQASRLAGLPKPTRCT